MVHRGTALFSRDMCVKQISNIVFTLFSKKAKRKPKKGSTIGRTEAVRPHTSSRLREPQTAPAPPRAQSAARLERGPHTHNARPHNSTTQNPFPTRKGHRRGRGKGHLPTRHMGMHREGTSQLPPPVGHRVAAAHTHASPRSTMQPVVRREGECRSIRGAGKEAACPLRVALYVSGGGTLGIPTSAASIELYPADSSGPRL